MRINFILILLLLSCTKPMNTTPVLSSTTSTVSSTSSTTSTTTTSTSTIENVMFVKIFFNTTNKGSFNGSSSTSTAVATQFFDATNTVLNPAPNWITSAQVGISGTCANFASAAESNAVNCLLTYNPSCSTALLTRTLINYCGAPTDQFRVSESDCSQVSAGTGASTDPVYFNVIFNRMNLASTENVLAILEYSAASINTPPSDPTTCWNQGTFSPESCVDFVWKAYLAPSSSVNVQPFLMIIPPISTAILPSSSTLTQYSASGGAALMTKQWVLPLAQDPTLTLLQVSRTGNLLSTSTSCLPYYCPATGDTNNSGGTPLCSGVIFYSLTLIRI